MKYVIIGSSGHHHQVTDALTAGLCGAPAAVAAGDAGEDMHWLSEFTHAPLYADWRAMLDEIRPELAVVNSYYGHLAEKSIYCLERGMHVYSEKPLAADLTKLKQLEDAWKASGRALGCMLNLSCCGWYKTLKAAVQAGEIGEVRLIHAQKSYRMGTRGPQYQTRESYGGTIPWVAIHAADWVLDLGGRCRQISAFHSSAANCGNGSMETTCALLMQLENGVIATIDADFLRPTGSARHDDDRLRVTGTRGMLEVIDKTVYLENESPRRALPLLEDENPFVRFINAVGTPLSDELARQALYDTRICLLARQAADESVSIKCE